MWTKRVPSARAAHLAATGSGACASALTKAPNPCTQRRRRVAPRAAALRRVQRPNAASSQSDAKPIRRLVGGRPPGRARLPPPDALRLGARNASRRRLAGRRCKNARVHHGQSSSQSRCPLGEAPQVSRARRAPRNQPSPPATGRTPGAALPSV